MSFKKFVGLCAHTQMLAATASGSEETLVGGQAVLEGVMMRAPHSYCVAVRKPDGAMVTEERPLAKMSEKFPVFQFPILRGIGTLGQAMTLGIKALRFSANAALDDGAACQAQGNLLLDADAEPDLLGRCSSSSSTNSFRSTWPPPWRSGSRFSRTGFRSTLPTA